ncbi:MAG: hypothetical protein U0X40_04475 [Ferruginibacter sp.]
MKNPSNPLTREHLEMAAALIEVLHDHLAVALAADFAALKEEHFLFGAVSEDAGRPYLSLSILGGGMGDYYSGSYDYQDIYRLEKYTDANGSRLWVSYDHEATNLAGDCSRFTASGNVTEAILETIETAFYNKLRAGVTIPKAWLSMLAQ